MSHAGLERMRPTHANGANVTLRADLIAANIFQRAAANLMLEDADDDRYPTFDAKAYSYAVECSFAAAAAFIAESRRRDPHTGLSNTPEGLPLDGEAAGEDCPCGDQTRPWHPAGWCEGGAMRRVQEVASGRRNLRR